MKLKIKFLREGAKFPTRGSKDAACFDLYISEDTILPPHCGTLVPTGIAMEIPDGYCVQLFLRSSMCKRGIVSSTGIVDSDYTGEVCVQAINVTDSPIELKKGDRIGQCMLVKLEETTLELTDTLKETERGSKGYGSTGR